MTKARFSYRRAEQFSWRYQNYLPTSKTMILIAIEGRDIRLEGQKRAICARILSFSRLLRLMYKQSNQENGSSFEF